MPTTLQLRERLLTKLEELFQLDKPDLDFGFYRVMHAKADEISAFLNHDLLQEIEKAFQESSKAKAKTELEKAREALISALGEEALEEDGSVKEAFIKLPAAKTYMETRAKAGSYMASLSDEGQIYEHLYRFFERYYDGGDFLSRRYYTHETPGQASPYAIPYNGEEVKLHWANADQYYIKTAEYFNNYSFDLKKGADENAKKNPQSEISFSNTAELSPTLPVHFRIKDATEGEHGNIKSSDEQKRSFFLHAENPIEFNEAGELIIYFEYRPERKEDALSKEEEESLKKLYGAKNKGDLRNLSMTKALLDKLTEHNHYQNLFSQIAPTDAVKLRPLLVKYIYQYTATNTMDYFIHKDLGGFLKRELDFYIKNEIIRLDDLTNENTQAPAVEDYLAKVKVLRRIALKLIDFLAQMEDFQKKLWLKKKFVVETNYCMTLDRVPEALYGEIAENDAQREEWVKLFAIDEIGRNEEGSHEGAKMRSMDLFEEAVIGYSVPLSVEFLKANKNLVLDTKFFSEDFKAKLLESIDDLDSQCDGLLVHSENFQALTALQERYREQVKCVYIDPPYNTGSDEFVYKDSYQTSSWISMFNDRVAVSYDLLKNDGAIAVSIDDNEIKNTLELLDIRFGRDNRVAVIAVKMSRATGVKMAHEDKKPVRYKEYLVLYCKQKDFFKVTPQYIKTDEIDSRYNKFIENISDTPDDWVAVDLSTKVKHLKKDKNDLLNFYKEHSKSICRLAANDQHEFNITKGTKKFQEVTTATGLKKYAFDGQKVLFYDSKMKIVDGELVFAENAGDYWSDIVDHVNDLSNEGGVTLKKGKKPEFLLQRIIELVTNKNDLLLDFCLGSGTSSSVSQKLGRKWIGVELMPYFYDIPFVRLKNTLFGETRGISKACNWNGTGCLKYTVFESYEDTLNNLTFDEDAKRKKAITENPSLKEDYMLRYLLEIETRGSSSLLNIQSFSDPTNYRMLIKKPGSDESVEQPVDLIETFNYLIGLRVENISAPQTFTAEFERANDPDLPAGQPTKLIVKERLKKAQKGDYWFRVVTGWVPRNASIPDKETREEKPQNKEKVLIIWRKLTDDLEKDNTVLDEFFQRRGLSTLDTEFDTIYVNGSNTLPNLKKETDRWKVILTEEAFMKKMWEVEG